jgi:hypothetical protein
MMITLVPSRGYAPTESWSQKEPWKAQHCAMQGVKADGLAWYIDCWRSEKEENQNVCSGAKKQKGYKVCSSGYAATNTS